MANAINLPVSADPTFTFRVYDITPVTYRSVVFQCKAINVDKKWVLATMTGPTIIHHNKSAGIYKSAMRWCIAKKCNLENKSEIYILTDDEPALIAACLKGFKKCLLLRRTKHFKGNCKDFLIGKGIKWIIKGAMLDVVFGKHGFVEAENKED